VEIALVWGSWGANVLKRSSLTRHHLERFDRELLHEARRRAAFWDRRPEEIHDDLARRPLEPDMPSPSDAEREAWCRAWEASQEENDTAVAKALRERGPAYLGRDELWHLQSIWREMALGRPDAATGAAERWRRILGASVEDVSSFKHTDPIEAAIVYNEVVEQIRLIRRRTIPTLPELEREVARAFPSWPATHHAAVADAIAAGDKVRMWNAVFEVLALQFGLAPGRARYLVTVGRKTMRDKKERQELMLRARTGRERYETWRVARGDRGFPFAGNPSGAVSPESPNPVNSR
jgi:hypothetical protein